MNHSRILVVEDEPIVALDLQRHLEKLGYDVPAVAASGEEALASADLSSPDLVLMDINLEGDMDGVETAERMRRHHRVPVIYLTAYSNDRTLQRAKVTEPYGYLLKPFEERELQTTIEIALYRHRAEQALHRAHDDLEQRVAERTAELHEANLSLQREVVERRRRAAQQLALQRVREEIWRMQSRAGIQKNPGGDLGRIDSPRGALSTLQHECRRLVHAATGDAYLRPRAPRRVEKSRAGITAGARNHLAESGSRRQRFTNPISRLGTRMDSGSIWRRSSDPYARSSTRLSHTVRYQLRAKAPKSSPIRMWPF